MRAACLLAAGSLVLSGCVAAVIPVAAGATMGRKVLKAKSPRAEKRRKGEPTVTLVPGGELPAPDGTVRSSAAPGAVTTVSAGGATGMPTGAPSGMQYLYGSGEAAAASLQAYAALRNYVSAEARLRTLGVTPDSVVLEPGAMLAAPTFVACGKKPIAVVLDIDETALLNLGYERDAALTGVGFDAVRWARWEATGARQVSAVPGAVEALAAARKANVTVVFNSNRTTASAAATQDALERAGLGRTIVGDTLWLREAGAPSGKDARRWAIAQKYCVVALVGDQLGDFTDLFNTAPATASIAIRRDAAAGTPVASLWGAGWFMLPNPVYGTALQGKVDDIFPADKRWSPTP